MAEFENSFISKGSWKIITSIILSIMISFIGIFEVSILKKLIGVYQLASIVVIVLIVIYLLVPITISNYIDILVTSIIVSLTSIFIYIHNSILWSPHFSGLSLTILPLSAIVKTSLTHHIIRPVIEIDWGQIVIVLVLLKIWTSLLKYLRGLKF